MRVFKYGRNTCFAFVSKSRNSLHCPKIVFFTFHKSNANFFCPLINSDISLTCCSIFSLFASVGVQTVTTPPFSALGETYFRKASAKPYTASCPFAISSRSRACFSNSDVITRDLSRNSRSAYWEQGSSPILYSFNTFCSRLLTWNTDKQFSKYHRTLTVEKNSSKIKKDGRSLKIKKNKNKSDKAYSLNECSWILGVSKHQKQIIQATERQLV